MKGVHPRRRILVMTIGAFLLGIGYLLLYHPAVAEYRETQAAVLKSSNEVDAMNQVLEPALRKKKEVAELRGRVRREIHRYSQTPSLRAVLKRFSEDLAAQGLGVASFAPMTTKVLDEHVHVGTRLLGAREEGFQVRFVSPLDAAVAIVSKWENSLLPVRLDRVQLLPHDRSGDRLEVLVDGSLLTLVPVAETQP